LVAFLRAVRGGLVCLTAVFFATAFLAAVRLAVEALAAVRVLLLPLAVRLLAVLLA
jgi:hypothetical protein